MSEPALDPLRSVHTTTFGGVLRQAQSTLVVTTYQAGRVILVRADGQTVNTHFRTFSKPMGCAVGRGRLTIGCTSNIWFLRNVPAVSAKREPPGKHDAVYLPRRIHYTGDIDIHEMAYDDAGELWFVNTRFSTLCTLDSENSFVPRWRPHFVTALALEDRCHLNGLALRDGAPRYVTALGETDSLGGWRVNKRDGGILMDVPGNEVLLRGLSMPHSPRWYRDRLWFLESGKGSLAWVDLATREIHTVAHLPGFTRGLDFLGPLAFIGLSQVRETATFSGLPLTERLEERTCGVWVVNIETGETVAFLRFEEGVQEIFAVQLLVGVRFPDIVESTDELVKSSFVVPDHVMSDVVQPRPKA